MLTERLQRIQANAAMPPPNLGSIAGARPRFSLRGQSTVKWHWQPADEVHTNTPKDKLHQYEIEGTGKSKPNMGPLPPKHVYLNVAVCVQAVSAPLKIMERRNRGCARVGRVGSLPFWVPSFLFREREGEEGRLGEGRIPN